jgi:hypothetical protein
MGELNTVRTEFGLSELGTRAAGSESSGELRKSKSFGEGDQVGGRLPKSGYALLTTRELQKG